MSQMRTRWMGNFLLLAVAAIGCTPSASQSDAMPAGPARSGVSAAQSGPDARPTVTVDIKDFQFVPDTITLPPGARIVFVNHDETPHNVVHGTPAQVSAANHEPLFESPELNLGDR